MRIARIAFFCLILTAAFGAFARSSISIMKMGGDIVVDDAPNGATLRTMGGDITVNRGRGTVIAKTMGGNIEIREFSGKLEASSMGGRVRAHVTGGTGNDISLYSMGGEIEILLPRNFAASFSIEIRDADKGETHRIVSDFPLVQTVSHRWSFIHGTNDTITATSASSNAPNRVDISTYGSNVTIRKE
jgi:DUF4097 and DUF4098 domain-containing protein YvlB